MTTHLERDVAQLKQKLLTMGGLVEGALRDAVVGLMQGDVRRAERASQMDVKIDRMELEIDSDGIKLLALHQPVAGDLRLIVAAMKITTDLERIGDLCGNIASLAMRLSDQDFLTGTMHMESMTRVAREMLRDSLSALVTEDTALARRVCQRDDEVDDYHADHFRLLIDGMKDDPSCIESAVALLSVSRNIERVADLATNIAEDVVFLVEAIDIRHPSLSPTGTKPAPSSRE